jgi:spermidine/putrescine transport system substrate-binding protein
VSDLSLSRRQLLQRLALAGIVLPATPAILAACGSSSPAGTTPGSAGTAAGTSSGSSSGGSTAQGSVTGTINFLNFTGWAGKDTYKMFAEKFPGSKVNEVPWQSSDDSIAKAKGRSGDIDVLLVDGTTFPSLDALGVLAEFGDKVPNLANIDAEFTGKSWDPKNTRFAATDYGRTGFAYRRDLVKETPKTWAEFYELMAKYKGKIGLLDYQRSVMGSILKSLSLPASSKEAGDLAKVGAKLKEIKPNLLAIAVEPGKQLVSGDLVMAWADAYDIYTAQQKNPDIVWVDPTEGQVAYLEGLAVLKGPREDLGKTFVNYSLEKDRYADFINTVNSAGVMSGNDLIGEKLRTNPVLNPSPEVRKKITFHDVLGDAQELWQTTWDAFKAA